MKYFLTFPVSILLSLSLYSQSDSSKTSSITVWGYVDAYYAYNFNQPPSRVIGQMVNRNSHVYSHNRHNEFNVNNGILGIKYSKDKVRGAFALHSGTYVVSNYFAEPDVFKNIYEAYAGYQISKKTWVDAGIFASHIGFESAISFDCQTLSRSMMADNTPYFETGIKITHEVTNKLILTGLVLNGWQNIIDHNKNKALGTQIQYKPSGKILINWSTFYGKEAGAYENTSGIVNTDSLSTRRFFNNFYVQANLNEKLSMTADFDIGFQEKRSGSSHYTWYSPNLILKYAIVDQLAVSGRAEYYSDKNGVIINSGTPNGFQTFASSLNFDFKFTNYVLWRIEGKILNSKDKVYVNESKSSNKSTLVLSSLAIKF
ncbi:MAG TPA: porin [Cytophagaceae bacterium]|nr:porin [Cytophagaceae bacterium]